MSEGRNSSLGFMWGLIIGAALGSLLSTKKGRKIIKEISEHGLESLENIMNIDEIKEVMDEGVAKGKEIFGDEEDTKPVFKKRPRLFRGIKRKSN